jgi:hypothetical protein
MQDFLQYWLAGWVWMILLHRHSGGFFFSFANLKFLKVLKSRIHAKIGNSSQVYKTTLSAKIRKLAKTDSSEGLFFLFSFSPSQNWKQQQGTKKNSSPDHACAPLLTKTPQKNLEKKEQMGMVYDPNTSKKTKNRSQPISDHTLKNQNPATKPKKAITTHFR